MDLSKKDSSILIILSTANGSILLGVIVHTKDNLPASPVMTKDIALKMAPNRFGTFTHILNMDCTLLISFCSDISHGGVEIQEWYA